jgi:hypothetical protein
MKTIQIVNEHPSMSYSSQRYIPTIPLEEFKGNLNEIQIDIAHNQDTAPGQGQDMPRYKVENVEMPDWMDAKFYIQSFSIIGEIFFDVGKDISEQEFNKWVTLFHKGKNTYDAIVKLVKQKTFRSEFRKSLRAQVDAWFANPEPVYSCPLSPKQMECITRDYTGQSSSGKYPMWAMRGRA